MEQSTLVICQNRRDAPDAPSVVVLSEVIAGFDETELNDVYNTVENADVPHDYSVPVYDIVANHVWEAVELHDSSPQRMELLIPLYRHLADRVGDDVDSVHCIGISGRYLDVVRDLADNENLVLDVSDVQAESITTRSIAVRSVGWLLVSIFDAFVSLLLRPFFSLTDAETLVKYPVFRPNTFRLIQNRIDMKFDSVFTLLTVSYIHHVRSAVDEQSTVMPIRCFSTVSGMLNSYHFFVVLIYDLLITNGVESEIVETVERETGVRLDHTVGRLSRRAIWSNFSAYLYYRAACQLYEKGTYRTALVTSSGPTGKAFTVSSAEYGVEPYSLPHAISNQLGNNNKVVYAGVFTEGTITDRRIEETVTRFIPTGFPKHIWLYNKRESIPATESDNILLIATQAYADVPREFVGNLIPAVLDRTEWRIVVKTHPSEETEKYSRHLSETDLTERERDRVRITDSDLHSWIGRSRLLLTTNSNVGLESVILGTPAVSYNPWSPEIRDPLYAKHGSVPSLREPSDIVTLLAEFDGDEECTRQEAMLDELYMVRNNSIDKIASRIQTELTGSHRATHRKDAPET